MLDQIAALNDKHFQENGDPEIQSRIAQYEMAYRMQTSVPEVINTDNEPDYIYKMYGADAKNSGNFCRSKIRSFTFVGAVKPYGFHWVALIPG